MFVVESVEDLWNHVAYVLLYAPNFPYRDFLETEQQMTLAKAFELLRTGVEIAYPEEEFEGKRQELHAILDRSLLAYENELEIEAGTLLNEFESRIYKK